MPKTCPTSVHLLGIFWGFRSQLLVLSKIFPRSVFNFHRSLPHLSNLQNLFGRSRNRSFHISKTCSRRIPDLPMICQTSVHFQNTFWRFRERFINLSKIRARSVPNLSRSVHHLLTSRTCFGDSETDSWNFPKSYPDL